MFYYLTELPTFFFQSGMGPDVIDLEAKAAADPDGSDNPDDFIMLKYRDAMGTAHKFLTVFLEKCRSAP